MVLAGVLIDKSEETILKEWGAKDSKQLSSEIREIIAHKIKEKFSYHAEITTAEEIDEKTKIGINLNRVEAIKAARIINELLKSKTEKIKVIIDCPSPNTEAWKNQVLAYVEKKSQINLHCEHKADINHLVCSAASIIAKTTRDSEIGKLKSLIGKDFGSGYASDPVTSDFLEKNLALLEQKGIIRKCWDTYSKAKEKKEQKKLF